MKNKKHFRCEIEVDVFAPACNFKSSRWAEFFLVDNEEDVTCKRCLKIIRKYKTYDEAPHARDTKE